MCRPLDGTAGSSNEENVGTGLICGSGKGILRKAVRPVRGRSMTGGAVRGCVG